MGRNFGDVSVKEARIVAAGLLGEHIDVGARGEGATGFIEADVSVCADSEDLEVNAASVADCLVVVCCGLIVVTGPDVGAVRGSLGEIYAVNKETVDEVRVAFGGGPRAGRRIRRG